MQIDESDEQCQNADFSIRKSRERDSNVIAKSDRHRKKHLNGTESTPEGIEMDESEPQSKNTEYKILESREPGSNVTLERERQTEKEHW
jgi:hypothetical protein